MKRLEAYRFPTPRGIFAATRSLKSDLPESKTGPKDLTFTDRFGVAGICLIFPEYLKSASDILDLVRLGHYVDEISDRGFFQKNKNSKDQAYREVLDQKISYFNLSYTDFLNRHYYDRPDIVANLVGFLAQAATVEAAASKWQNPSQDQTQTYRELITAIWTRMVVSAGEGLSGRGLDNIANEDTISPTYNQLVDLYKDYIHGQDESAPQSKRNHALFVWTLGIQETFDKHNHQTNAALQLPTFTPRVRSIYESSARSVGIHPMAYSCVNTFFGLLLSFRDSELRKLLIAASKI